MATTGTRRCASCGRDVAKRLPSCPRCGADRDGVRIDDDQPAVSGPISTPARSPLFRPSARRGWSPDEYLVYGGAVMVCSLLVVGLGLLTALGALELLVLVPLSLLSVVWLGIGVVAKGVEVGRRATRD